MTNTFLNRVAAERRVLSVVNGRFSRVDQLTGLSRAAIAKWCASVGLERAVSIKPILLALAEKCQRLSDRSNETFLQIDLHAAASIERHLVELEGELDRCI